MVALWLLAQLLAVLPLIPSPGPSGSPPAGNGLKEIAHVRSSACQPLLTAANSAIDAAIQNDATLVQTIRALHTTYLDGNEMDRQNSLKTLGDLATNIDRNARAGQKEIKRLRELASNTTGPTKKQELLAFANALGGAIGRQDSISQDLTGFVNNLEERDMRHPSLRPDTGDFLTPPPGTVRPAYLPDDDAMAVSMATDFISRLHDISVDEAASTVHAEGATTGC